jgi:hypothetical protein
MEDHCLGLEKKTLSPQGHKKIHVVVPECYDFIAMSYQQMDLNGVFDYDQNQEIIIHQGPDWRLVLQTCNANIARFYLETDKKMLPCPFLTTSRFTILTS